MSCHPVSIKVPDTAKLFISLSSSALKTTINHEVFGRCSHLYKRTFISAFARIIKWQIVIKSNLVSVKVLSACVAAAAAQGFYGLQSFPNGAVVPVDEPAVAAARADHLALKGAIAPVGYAAAPAVGYGYAAAPAVGYGYAAAPTVGYAASPVAAAPAVAYTGYNAAPVAYAGYSGYAPAYGYAGPLNLNTQLIAHPNGAVVPVDEPAVAAARADHLAVKGQAYAYAPAFSYAAAPAIAPVSYAAAPAIAPVAVAAPAVAYNYGYAGPLNLNTQLIAHPNGAVVPVDEPAVAAARADHLATKGVAGGLYAGAVAPAVYGAGYAAGFYGLVAHPNGAVVPVDEPAVAAARADHLALKGAVY